MQRLIRRNSLRLVLGLAVLGSIPVIHAEERAPDAKHYRQEVRDRLSGLQSSLDQLFANRQLTSTQYQAESERVRQLQLQMSVDAQAEQIMTEDDRNNQYTLIDQIKQEASRAAIDNRSTAQDNNPVVPVNTSSAPVTGSSASVSSSSATVNISSAPSNRP